MKKDLIVKAEFLPLEVEEVKLRPELRISGSVDDLVLLDLVGSATEAYEEFTDNVLCYSTWDFYFDSFPEAEIEIPAPLTEVESIGYTDSAGALQTIDEADYVVDGHSKLCGRIAPAFGKSWPASSGEINSVVVRAIVGYANPAAIPRRIKDGLILKIQELYYGTPLDAVYHACWANFRRMRV